MFQACRSVTQSMTPLFHGSQVFIQFRGSLGPTQACAQSSDPGSQKSKQEGDKVLIESLHCRVNITAQLNEMSRKLHQFLNQVRSAERSITVLANKKNATFTCRIAKSLTPRKLRLRRSLLFRQNSDFIQHSFNIAGFNIEASQFLVGYIRVSGLKFYRDLCPHEKREHWFAQFGSKEDYKVYT